MNSLALGGRRGPLPLQQQHLEFSSGLLCCAAEGARSCCEPFSIVRGRAICTR